MSVQTGTPTLAPAPAMPAIGFFERWLSLWVFLCIVTGIVVLRAVLADLLAEALPGEEPDQVGGEQDGDGRARRSPR